MFPSLPLPEQARIQLALWKAEDERDLWDEQARQCWDFSHIIDVATGTCFRTLQIGNIMQISYISPCAESQRVVDLMRCDKGNPSHKLHCVQIMK